MAVQKGKKNVKPKKASPAKISEKTVMEAMTNLERLAKDYIGQARDTMRTGRKITNKIREMADNIENELFIEGVNQTEAYDSSDAIGMGIGVL
jgi:hypothetical protein